MGRLDEARGHLALLFDGYTEGYVEIARGWRAPDGRLRMRRRDRPEGYASASDIERLVALGGGPGEVFVGAVPRLRPEPRKTAVGSSRVVWVDVDPPVDRDRLRRFGRPAHVVVGSGSGLHLYWRLAEAIPPEEAEEANRRLARRLGADPAACDRLRMMRLAGSWNGRARRRARLLAARAGLAPYALGELLEGVAAEPGRAPNPSRARPAPGPSGPVVAWFEALTGVRPGPDGACRCPLPDHDDAVDSCRVYEGRGWWCFGCARGGSAVDLASLMSGGPWGSGLRGRAFAEALERARAADELRIAA